MSLNHVLCSGLHTRSLPLDMNKKMDKERNIYPKHLHIRIRQHKIFYFNIIIEKNSIKYFNIVYS